MEDTPPFIALHLQQHVQCLSQFFDVTLVDANCDYREICDRYQPDLALFESGVYAGKSDRQIANVSAHSEIPKIGFCHTDGFCFSRQIFFSDMERWGVDTFFGLSLAMAEYTPEVADRLFVWPNCVDADLFRDYGASKVIPVAITGSHAPLYPWRNRVSKLLQRHYPSLVSPHFGWSSNAGTARMVYGEPYARMLNAAWMVPTCGTMANDLVRKHLEIPGSRACLITERTPAVIAAGFEDMQNCVFADESDVIDKVDWLFRHPDDLQRVVDAGYQLVQSRHTMRQRNQLLQWFELRRTLQPHEVIVQSGPFEPLSVADASRGAVNTHVTRDGLDRVLMRLGDERLRAGRYQEAESFYLQCLNYYPLSEPKLRLALVSLYKGDAARARRWVEQPIAATLGARRSVDPDPVEWAYFIIALLCEGRVSEASARSRQFLWLRHPELDRVRVLVSAVAGDAVPACGSSPRRYTVHQLPDRPAREWTDEICTMLVACRQGRLAETVRAAGGGADKPLEATGERPARPVEERERALPLTTRRLLPSIRAAVRKRVESAQRIVFPALERRLGPFLPYDLSIARQDELLATIESIGRHDVQRKALVVGASAGVGVTEAFLAGVRRNSHQAAVVCINRMSSGLEKLRRRYSNSNSVTCLTLTSERLPDGVKGPFDVVVIDGSELLWRLDCPEIGHAAVVVLDDINNQRNYENRRLLIDSGDYELVLQNPARAGGYAVFRKITETIGGEITPRFEETLVDAEA